MKTTSQPHCYLLPKLISNHAQQQSPTEHLAMKLYETMLPSSELSLHSLLARVFYKPGMKTFGKFVSERQNISSRNLVNLHSSFQSPTLAL